VWPQLARHWVTCGSKPGVGKIFSLLWPFSVSCYLSLGFSSKLVQSLLIVILRLQTFSVGTL